MSAALKVQDLVVELRRHRQRFHAVDGISFELRPGTTLGLVGESGCGKSITLRAVMGLLPHDGRVTAGTVEAEGRIGLVFQDPLSALNPVMTVGRQVAEAPQRVLGLSKRQAKDRALELLRMVGVPDPVRRAEAFPHELSGGTRQRVMIAMALSSDPKILLCDEPTTALDVTIQAQILRLLADLQAEMGLSTVFVTHDLAVVSELCDDLAVMYAGRIVETGPAGPLLREPRHPYTAGLVGSVLDLGHPDRHPTAIPGALPDPLHRPTGCSYHPRCRWATPDCATVDVRLLDVAPGRQAACIHHDALAGEVPYA